VIYNPNMTDDTARVREVLFEFHRIGNYIRVSAIDTRTNTEIHIVGAPGYGDETLKRLALRKLKWVLLKKRRLGQIDDDSGDVERPSDGSILA